MFNSPNHPVHEQELMGLVLPTILYMHKSCAALSTTLYHLNNAALTQLHNILHTVYENYHYGSPNHFIHK